MSTNSKIRALAPVCAIVIGVLGGSARGGLVSRAPIPPMGIERPAGAALDLAIAQRTAARVVLAHLDEESVPAAENPGAPVLGGDAPENNPGPSTDWEQVPVAGASPVAGNSMPPQSVPNGAPPPPATVGATAAPVSTGAAPASAGAGASVSAQPSSSPASPIAPVASAQRASTAAPNAGTGTPNVDVTAGAVGAAGAAAEQQADVGPPPALDLSTVQSAPDLSAVSLTSEFKSADTPARAAALRVTEQARVELAAGNIDGALRDLGRAVSIDPGNPFEYFYLGRAYLARGNYAQALTFFERAEIGFATRQDWLGETVGFEGACQEELGQMTKAAAAYRRALESAPGDVRARVGYSRLAAYMPNAASAQASAPSAGAGGEPPPPPERTAAGPAPVEAPPPPPPAPRDPAVDWQKTSAAAAQPD